jgi:hypothetical protein
MQAAQLLVVQVVLVEQAALVVPVEPAVAAVAAVAALLMAGKGKR